MISFLFPFPFHFREPPDARKRERNLEKKQREITASALLRSYLVTDVLHSSSSANQLAVDRCVGSLIRQSWRIVLQVLLLPSSMQSISSSLILSGQNSSPVQPYNLSSSSLLVFRWLLEIA
ncbi:uncharacterized protein LOC129314059 [Prosopis cineraria]|uniref:uncharacterized protein LOC129314059 n=1 Tax=Prosopis cineraria TaxID=364024 RepID=UPI00241021BB|nr:uncharacterized protein LOC129314059 [Prosopis cineraria]